MSIRFADSWDHYSTAELTPSKKWHNRRLSTNFSPIIAGGRFSSNLFNLTIWTGDSRLIVHFDSQATWIVGFAFKINKGNPLQGPMRPLSFLDNDVLQCYLQIDKDSIPRFYNGSDVLLAASTKPYPQDNFQFVEVKVTLHSSAGTVQVRINEETVINATSQATQVTGVNTADGICIGPTGDFSGGSANNDGYFDDFYVCDTLGAQHTDFLGDVHIEAIVPNATGGSSQFAPVGTTPNYTNVDESSAPNSDTDYNLGSVIGHRDLYKFPAFSLAPGQQNELTAVITNMWLRKDFAGTRTVRSVLARATGTALGTAFAFDGSYAYHLQDIFDVNPVGGTAWGHGDVNATEFGIDIVT